jgi:hypothetical protein
MKNIKLNSRTSIEWLKEKSHSNSFIKSSLHVGPSLQEVFRRRRKPLQQNLGDNLVKLRGL